MEERVHRRTAELEAANQELESFAYAVSHDLRAPLRAMSGFSQALLEDYGERLDGEARVGIDQITLSSRHMSDLIDGLLALSRSTRGKLRRDSVDLAALAERLLAEQAAAEPERQVAWRVEPELHGQGDPVMLEVVMRNLIENAWKYTAKTPHAMIRVYIEDQEGERCFCVADNGAGFDMSHANRLFQAFQRLHRQDEFPGIGIGLIFVALVFYGVSLNLAVPMQQKYGGLPVLWRAQMVAFVLVTPFVVPSIDEVQFAWGPFLAVVALGVFGTALAFVVMASNAGRLGSTRASVSVYLVPVVSLLLGALVRHETVALLAIVGCAIAVLGAYLTNRARA